MFYGRIAAGVTEARANFNVVVAPSRSAGHRPTRLPCSNNPAHIFRIIISRKANQYRHYARHTLIAYQIEART